MTTLQPYANCELTLVVADGVHQYWPRIAVMLQQSPETWKRTESLESIYYKLMHGFWQLWVLTGDDKELLFHFITQHCQHDTGRVLQVLWGSGADPEQIVNCLVGSEEYAKNQGLQGIEIFGRPGWGKFLAPKGYEQVHVAYWKDLSNVDTKQQ